MHFAFFNLQAFDPIDPINTLNYLVHGFGNIKVTLQGTSAAEMLEDIRKDIATQLGAVPSSVVIFGGPQ